MIHKFVLLQEVDTGAYRIIELFLTSDGPRTRLCEYRTMKLDEARENIEARKYVLSMNYKGNGDTLDTQEGANDKA